MKNKVFWLRQKQFVQVGMLGIIIGIVLCLITYFPELVLSTVIQTFISTQFELIIIGLMIYGAFLFNSCLYRLIITKEAFIYTTLFTKKEFSKSEHKIIGSGMKEEYFPGHGEDSGSTEYWYQLNIVKTGKKPILEIKVKSTKKYYQKIVSYLKMDEWIEQSNPNGLVCQNQEGLDNQSFEPLAEDRYRKEWSGWVYTAVVGIIAAVILYKFIPLPLLTENWRRIIISCVLVITGFRHISFKKKVLLKKLEVGKGTVSMNGVRFKDEDVLRFSMSASSDEGKKNEVHFLEVVYKDGGKKRKVMYYFNIGLSQKADYQQIEQKLLEKYGKQYQVLFH